MRYEFVDRLAWRVHLLVTVEELFKTRLKTLFVRYGLNLFLDVSARAMRQDMLAYTLAALVFLQMLEFIEADRQQSVLRKICEQTVLIDRT